MYRLVTDEEDKTVANEKFGSNPIPFNLDSKFLQYLTEECVEVVSNCSTATEQ